MTSQGCHSIGMPGVCAEAGCNVVLMHSRGSVADMASYDKAVYGSDPVGIFVGARESIGMASERSIRAHAVSGIASRKKPDTRCGSVCSPSYCCARLPVFVGASRKRVIAELIATPPAPAALRGERRCAPRFPMTTGTWRPSASTSSRFCVARIFRVHRVRANRLPLIPPGADP